MSQEKRRSAGSYRLLPSGKYQLAVSEGTDSNGHRQRHYKTITAKNDREAEKALAAFITEVEGGNYVEPTKLDFEEVFYKWIDSHQGEKELAPKTKARYEELFKLRIKEYFNRYKLEKINATIIDDFFTEIRNSERLDNRPGKLSEQSIKHHYRLISAVFAYAYRKGLIKLNPMEKAESVTVSKKDIKCYDEEQISVLIEALEEVEIKFKTAINIALNGLRLGEVMGLEWSDVDYKNNTIRIERVSQYIAGKGVITKSPKTKKSKRVISMPVEVMSMIRQLEIEQKEQRMKVANKWENSNRLFTTEFGAPMFPETPSKWFSEFIRNHNKKVKNDPEIREDNKSLYLLPEDVTFHGLRHTSVSYLIANGEDVATIAQRHGHSNANTTLSIYAHSFKKRDEAAADKMSGMYKHKAAK